MHAIFYSMHFADPLTNVLQMGLREGMKVADLGSGSGHYAVCAANIVGESGKVYALDIQRDVLGRIESDAKERGLPIETLWADLECDLPFKDSSLDAAILSNTLFQVADQAGLMKELRRVLKEKGKLLVVDWAGAYGGIGPHEEHVVTEQEAEELLISSGFHKAKTFRGGPHHYALVFAAP